MRAQVEYKDYITDASFGFIGQINPCMFLLFKN